MAYAAATKKRGKSFLEPKQSPPAGKRIWYGKKTSAAKARGKEVGRK